MTLFQPHVTNHVRSAIFECLNIVLNPDQQARAIAEERLRALEVTEEYGVILAELTVDSKELPPLRQLCSVLLRQYVEHHWSEQLEKFTPPETQHSVKATIKALLPQGLSEPQRQIRTSVACAISSIAHWDWPDEWPQLFNILVEALTSGDSNSVHGSMRVLAEFTKDITDTQMPQVALVILPELYRIFVTTAAYSNRTRARAVDVFITCANVIIEMSQVDKHCLKQLLLPMLAQFVEAFLQALQSKDSAMFDTGLKTSVVKALTCLFRSLPSHLRQQTTSVVPCIWGLLVTCSDLYVRTVVTASAAADDPTDSDGEVLGTEGLIYALFEFIHVLIDSPKMQSILQQHMQQLLYYIMLYMQITSDQEEAWSQSPSQFIEDEDEDSFSYSVRISAQDLFLALISEFENEGLAALAENIHTHLTRAEQCKQTGSSQWWKIHEAVFLAMGSVRMMFVGAIKEQRINFNLADFFQNVVLVDLASQDTQFLTGRCLWMSSRFAHAMDMQLVERFLHATVIGLEEKQPACVRVSAVRAIYNFCDMLLMTKQTGLLTPLLPTLFECVLGIAQAYSTEVLAICLDALEHILKVDVTFTAGVAEKATPFMSAVFLKYSHDQHVIEICKDILKHLSVARNDLVQQKLLPMLLSIIEQRQPDKLPVSLQPCALEMLETLVRSSPEPLSPQLMSMFSTVANLTVNTDDNSIMQNGGECLRGYISKSAQQVVHWHDDHGHSGLSYIGSVVSKLLDPKAPEFSAAYVGRLVSLLITKLENQMGSDLDLILRAVLSKLQQTETLTIIQELVMVFARLVLANTEALVEFLTMTPGPDGSPALNFVLKQWCGGQHLFFGAYETKIGCMALSKLLLYAINSNDSRLQQIYLKEQIISTSAPVTTRSKAKASLQPWTDVPILIKMYKLLINELAHQTEEAAYDRPSVHNGPGEGAEGDGDGYEDIDSDDEDGDYLSGLLDNVELEEDDERDPDVLSDPIYQVNLKDYLAEFLQALARTPFYQTFKAHHTAQEQKVLALIGVV